MIQVHIGDFSVARQNVHAFCSREECRQKALKMLCGVWLNSPIYGPERGGAQYMVFSDMPWNQTSEDLAALNDICEGAPPDRAFLFLVDIPRAISTN